MENSNLNILGFESDGIYYEIISDTCLRVISGPTKYSGSISIPSIVLHNGTSHRVISIGDKAFEDCSNLTAITIPNGVGVIGYSTFKNCINLTAITIPNSVTFIGSYAFQGCSSLTAITIPSRVTKIYSFTFKDCSSLTYITIPNSITEIYPFAFENCFSLASITIPTRVTSIGEYAFYGCSNLTAITIPNGVITIGNATFGGCSSLDSIYIPDSVTTIGKSAFDGCSSLASITIPTRVTSIGEYAFSNCSSLTTITISNGATTIGESAFDNCSNLTAITIPNSVTKIDEGVFTGCSNLETISVEAGNPIYHSMGNCLIETATKTLHTGCKNSIIPTDGSVTAIGDDAFLDCSNLTAITLPNSVITIGKSAFNGCTSLAAITIPNSVKSIDNLAFRDCYSLIDIIIPNSVTTIADDAFYGCSSLETINVEIGNPTYHSMDHCLIETATKILHTGCKNSIIPTDGSVTTIGEGAFSECSGLTAITIPNSITEIGDYAFWCCFDLASLTIPNSVRTIGDYAFFNCSNLTAITIHNGVTTIGEDAFHNCFSLTTITIPNSVKSIGEDAFDDCSDLETIKVEAGNPTYHSIGNCLIETATKTLHTGCKNSIIPTDGSVTTIGKGAFKNCRKLSEITIPNSTTTIKDEAFSHCSHLKQVSLGSDVKKIGDYAFAHCKELATLSINTGFPPIIKQDTFEYIPKTLKIIVPKGTIKSYKSSPYWKEFTNYEESSYEQTYTTRFIGDANIYPTLKQYGLTEQDVTAYRGYDNIMRRRDDKVMVISMTIATVVIGFIFSIFYLTDKVYEEIDNVVWAWILNILCSLTVGWCAGLFCQWFLNPLVKIFVKKPTPPANYDKAKSCLTAQYSFTDSKKWSLEREFPGIKDFEYDLHQYGADCIEELLEKIQRFMNYRNADIHSKVRQQERQYWFDLDPFEFEKAVAFWYRQQGYDAKVTQQSGDGGVDIVLTKGSYKAFVQCKHYTTSKVDGPTLQQLYGVVMAEKADEGIVACLLGLTDAAAAFARKVNIKVVTVADLITKAKAFPQDKTLAVESIVINSSWCKIGDMYLQTNAYRTEGNMQIAEGKQYAYEYNGLYFKIQTSQKIFDEFVAWDNKFNQKYVRWEQPYRRSSRRKRYYRYR